MSLWRVRSGRQGQHLAKFVVDKRIYLTWGGFATDVATLSSRDELTRALTEAYPALSGMKLANNTGQIWRYAHEMQPQDWVIVPDKLNGTIHIAEITGPYTFAPGGPDPYFHYRDIRWIANDIPRAAFDPDLLFSFGGLMTIYRVQRNNAEDRIRAMARANWQRPEGVSVAGPANGTESDGESALDLEELAADELAKLIVAKFKGHGLARLVEAVLQAQGYTTFRGPPGADKGVDILAGTGPLGFGAPRICVQVKSGQSPIERAVLDQLIGTMQNVRANEGLLVSWGGFKQTVRQEEPSQFFRVRLWDQQKLVYAILENYDRLDASLRAELPLKRIWVVAREDTTEAGGDDS